MTELRKIQLQDPNDSDRLAEFDNLFKVPIVIDVGHHEVHEGDAFVCDAIDDTMGDNDTLALAFKTMAGTKRVHMLVGFTTLVGGLLELVEAPTWDNQSGAQHPIYNRLRQASMGSSGLLEDESSAGFLATDNLILNPTTLAGGTVIHSISAYGTKNFFSGAGRDVEEFILKPATQYAYRFTADGGSNAAHITLNWYEHTDE